MKKIVLAFGLFTLLFSFPVLAEVNFNVVNVSQDNADATRVGVRAGDVLRYEVEIKGEELVDESMATAINLENLLSNTTMVNSGGGILNESIITFPEEFCLTCDGQVFSFFVRANETCEGGGTLEVIFNEQNLVVPFHCELVDSGPGSVIFALLALILIFGYALISRRETY